MNWQRARTGDKKNERKDAIYQAALSLFKEKGYEGSASTPLPPKLGLLNPICTVTSALKKKSS